MAPRQIETHKQEQTTQIELHEHMVDVAQWKNTRLPTQGLRVRSPLTPTKITKNGDMYWFFPVKNAPVYQCVTLGTLYIMCGGRCSILHYGPLIKTNNMYAPTPNGQTVQVRR